MFRKRLLGSRRRGATALATVVLLPLMLGFVGLAVDVGMAYSVKADLQRAADAAALAGVRDLKGSDEGAAMANSIATILTYANSNPAFSNIPLVIDTNTDIEFGQAMLDEATGKVAFLAHTMPPGAVRVTVHADLPYTFARVMGFATRRISATAAAATGPRDVAIVMDVSGSMTHQSVESQVCVDLESLGLYTCRSGGGGSDDDDDGGDEDDDGGIGRGHDDDDDD